MRDAVTIPVELAFLRQCMEGADADANGLRSAAERVVDWPSIVEAADYHGVAPLVHAALEGVGAVKIPADPARRLRDAFRDSAKRGLVLSHALCAVLDALRDAGVDALPLKGPVLAAALYPDPALRPSSDIDILVRRQGVPGALVALTRVGYALGPRLARQPVQTLRALGTEVTMSHPHRPPVDLHWEIAQRGYPFRFDPEILWSSSRPATLDGREVPGISPERLLLFLCVHGAKHIWTRLMWLGDVARLARAIPDWSAAMDVACGAGCRRPVLLGILLAHDLLDAPVPETILARARTDPVLPRLAREVTRHLGRFPPLEHGIASTSFGARMAEHPWDKAKHFAALLGPSEAELELLRFPERLRLLYYPFRLARLAAKYTLSRRRHA